MSHFTVLVIGPDHEAALAPFQENNMGNCPKQYLAFHETETEWLEEFDTGTASRVVMPDGRLLPTWDDAFKVPSKFGFGSHTHKVPDDLERREVPFKELYADFNAFAKNYHGAEDRDPEKGRYGYWENPNKKWDWYTVGGRWSGMLKARAGADCSVGETGLMGSHFAKGDDRCDQARKGDIDWEGMRQQARSKASAEWEHCKAIRGEETWHSWLHVREVMHKGDIAAAREFYNSQPALLKLKAADKERYGWDVDDNLALPHEVFVKQAADAAGVTFAVLKDGNWYQRGEMGWWGCVSDEKDRDTWNAEFSKLIDGLPDDTLLTVVDCHI